MANGGKPHETEGNAPEGPGEGARPEAVGPEVKDRRKVARRLGTRTATDHRSKSSSKRGDALNGVPSPFSCLIQDTAFPWPGNRLVPGRQTEVTRACGAGPW